MPDTSTASIPLALPGGYRVRRWPTGVLRGCDRYTFTWTPACSRRKASAVSLACQAPVSLMLRSCRRTYSDAPSPAAVSASWACCAHSSQVGAVILPPAREDRTAQPLAGRLPLLGHSNGRGGRLGPPLPPTADTPLPARAAPSSLAP